MFTSKTGRICALNRSIGLNKAREEFEKDLKNDVDFIEYKRKFSEYRVPVATHVTLVINRIGITSEQLIKQFVHS